MEFKELNLDEQISVYGGNEVSEGILFCLGAVCKGVAYFMAGAREGGYSYCKCGM